MAADADEFEAVLAAIADDELALHGVVVEQHLEEVVTCSIGRLHVRARGIAYYGTQRSVRNHHGHDVYGGSDLRQRLDMPAPAREALGRTRPTATWTGPSGRSSRSAATIRRPVW